MRKKVPKSGHVHGPRNRRTTVPLRHPTPKRASANERAIKMGGAEGIPPRLFASGLSLEKARTQRVAGGYPPPPPFLWPARWHSLVLGLGGAVGRLCVYFGAHVRALIWELSFAKFFFSMFFLENASQIGLSIPKGIAPLPHQRQRSQKSASGNERL